MSKTLTKIKDVEYNEMVVLLLLYNNKQFWEIFKDSFKLSINTLITIAKNNGLSYETKETLETFFNDIVLTHSSVLEDYEKYLAVYQKKGLEKFISSEVKTEESVNAVTPSEPVVKEVETEKSADIIEGNKESVNLAVSTPKKVDKAKNKPNRKLPRRIGKEAIEKMIAENGGKTSQLHRVMLRINDLKNMYVKLQARGIKEMHLEDGSVLSDDECRAISSGITILEQKVASILKKK
jgi:hypothetical protein